jgi:alkaline phosphatase D
MALVGLVRPLSRVAAQATPKFLNYPFRLGVASGDPLADGVVLWTRLAPDPYDLQSIVEPTVEVRWQVAKDEAMQNVVRSGASLAHREHAHSVHVEVDGLEPDREYFYRFEAGSEESPVGHTRTLPLAASHPDSFRFALASCQALTDGYYAAYRDLVEQSPRLVVHLGDYIYENDWYGGVRRIPVPEATTLSEYRELHARYKLDPDLQAAHAATPWVSIWDDHEVDNDWGGTYNEKDVDVEVFLERKKAAFKAYYEHLPLRLSSRLRGEEMQIYRRILVGDLLELNLLDCRQYRDHPPCLDQVRAGPRYLKICDAARNPRLTLLGSDQEAWLTRGFGRAGATWNTLVQTTLMAPFDYLVGEEVGYDLDDWNSFNAPRQRILDLISQRRPSNPVILGANIHAFYAGVLHADPFDSASVPLATELISTSISASGGGEERYRQVNDQFAENPFARFFDNRQRGYLLCDLTHESWQTQLRVVADVRDPVSPASTLETLVIESGTVDIRPQ